MAGDRQAAPGARWRTADGANQHVPTNTDVYAGNVALRGHDPWRGHVRAPPTAAAVNTREKHYYFRDYDPVIGRYVESDPIGLRGGLNSFAYVENSPSLLLDRRGLDAAGRAIGRAVGMWGGRVIGGAVGSVEPGGGTAVGAWLGGTLGSAAGAAIGDAVGNWCKAQANDKDDCKKHFNDCLTSGWGGKVGFDSACLACFQRCQGTGTWPDSVTTGLRGQYPVSCEYWLKKP